MSFEVYVKKRKWVRIMQIICIFISIITLAAFTSLIRSSGSLLLLAIDNVVNNIPVFVAGFFALALLLPATILIPIFSFYHERRPRIKVDGSNITFYPLWRPAKKVTLSEITSRNVHGDTTGEKIDAAVGKALFTSLNPSFAYALEQRYETAQQTPKELSYTYYSGNKKLITLSTKRNMENLEQFDKMVMDKLAGKPLELETSAKETKSTSKVNFPLILTGLISLVCLIIIVANVSTPQTKPQSSDFLANTSWLSGDDNSQWVFGVDKTFHWYQTKGQTDDNYFAGTYEVYIGQDAINYLTSELSNYGITEKSIKQVIANNQEYTLNNFLCLSCVNQSFMLRGEEQLSKDVVSSYFGFLLANDTYLDIVNMTTGTYYGFTKE